MNHEFFQAIFILTNCTFKDDERLRDFVSGFAPF